MNELDYILGFIILVGVGVGLRRGFLRVLISIVGVYFTVLVAGYTSQPFGDILYRSLGELSIRVSATTAHNFIYIIVVVAMAVAVEVVSRLTFEDTLIGSIRGLDNLLGGLAGIFYGALWASLFLAPAQYGVSQTGGAWSTAVFQSTLVPTLNRVFQNAVLDIVRILFAGGIPEILLNQVSQRVSHLLPDLARLFLL